MYERNVTTSIVGLTTFMDFSGGIIVSQEYYDPVGIGVMELKRGKETSLCICGCTVQSLESFIFKCQELRQLIAEALKKTPNAKVVPAMPLYSATQVADAVAKANTTSILTEKGKELLGYSGPHFAKCYVHFDLDKTVILPLCANTGAVITLPNGLSRAVSRSNRRALS